jgi:hypothetical protein
VTVCLAFLVIVALLAFAYTWYVGKTRPVEQASTPVSTSPKPVVTATVVDENAPVGVAVQTVTSPVARGGNSSISIRTRPEAACSIRLTYSLTSEQDKESKDAGLTPKIADEYGVVSWTWTVEIDRPVGRWPIEVNCAYKDQWGYGKQMLVVT